MELRDYARVLRKQWRLIAVCLLGVVLTAVAITLQATPQYKTTVGFFVSTSDRSTDSSSSSAYTGGLFSQQRVKSYASIVAGPLMADRIATDLGGLPRSAVEGHLAAVAVPDTVLLTVTVTDPSPKRAVALAQSLARLFPQVADTLESPAAGGASSVKVSVIQQPRLPEHAFSPRPTRNIGLAVVLGLLLGVGLAVLREALDNTVKNPDDILDVAGTATLGAITFDPHAAKRPLVVQDSPQSPRAEAFRQLRTNLQFIEVDAPLRSLTITSSLPKEGKSTTACNLAITLAQAGVRTVLIEGDLRRPRIADYLGMEGAVGLTSVLIGRVSLEDALQPFGDGTLQVLASGPLPPNPSELLSSRGMRELIARLEGDFDMVIVDAPPLLPVTDAAVLGTMTSGAVLGVKCGSTRREQLRRAAETLNAVDAKILGAVLNMVPRRGPDAYYNYGGYGYGTYSAKTYGADASKLRMSDEDAALAIRSSTQVPEPAQSLKVDPSPGPVQLQPAELQPVSEVRVQVQPVSEVQVQVIDQSAATAHPTVPVPAIRSFEALASRYTAPGHHPPSAPAPASADVRRAP